MTKDWNEPLTLEEVKEVILSHPDGDIVGFSSEEKQCPVARAGKKLYDTVFVSFQANIADVWFLDVSNYAHQHVYEANDPLAMFAAGIDNTYSGAITKEMALAIIKEIEGD